MAEVWLVDLAARRVFVSRQGGIRDEAVNHELVWRTPAGPALRFDVTAFFTGVAAGDQWATGVPAIRARAWPDLTRIRACGRLARGTD